MALLIVKIVTVNLMVLTDINTRTQNVWSIRCQLEVLILSLDEV